MLLRRPGSGVSDADDARGEYEKVSEPVSITSRDNREYEEADGDSGVRSSGGVPPDRGRAGAVGSGAFGTTLCLRSGALSGRRFGERTMDT